MENKKTYSVDEVLNMLVVTPKDKAIFSQNELSFRMREAVIKAKLDSNLSDIEIATRANLNRKKIKKIESDPCSVKFYDVLQYLTACSI